jgi:type II secretory pathway component GspD/PulD (secretin)
MDIPVLKYIFSTETTSKEKSKVYLTIKAEVLDTGHPVNITTGTLKQIKTAKGVSK